jgi:2-polyprenyl-3-methyl-5-hydroxy-6-metoxy-1,4-benzoquinol methylase
MIGRLRERASRCEWMDDGTASGPQLQEAFRHLQRLNRLLGASGPMLYGVRQLWARMGKPGELTVLDAGSGSGDINRRLLKWADRRGIRIRIMLVDPSAEARIEAKRLFAHENRVVFVQRNVFDIPPRHADIVTASQFVHHLPSQRLPGDIRRLLDISRVGVVINDLHRHWMSWSAVWLLTRLLSRNRCIWHDGPLSVAKGFRRSEFTALARQLQVPEMICRWRPLFRYAVILPKLTEKECGRDA